MTGDLSESDSCSCLYSGKKNLIDLFKQSLSRQIQLIDWGSRRKEVVDNEEVPFVTKEQLDEIVKKYPTPFHLYDEKGIRENARKVYKAFSWNKGFKEYFAVKATPNPAILQIMKEEAAVLTVQLRLNS